MPSWPWTFATLPAGNVAASKLDDNFNAAMFNAGSSTNGAVATWNGTGGNQLNSGGLSVGIGANNLVQLNSNGFFPSGIFSPLTNILGSNVALNNTVAFFDGPSISQGTVGTWLVWGWVTCEDVGGSAQFNAKLWDGTTVLASGAGNSAGPTGAVTISLTGLITSPAGNLRMSAQDVTRTSGSIQYNFSGQSADSGIVAIRLS